MGLFKHENVIKGENFEKFVEDVLFPEPEYDLVYKTRDFAANKDRFAKDTTRKPDFMFESSVTKQPFYVEAKFRSNMARHGDLNVFDLNQFNRFMQIQENEGIPVYVAIGLGGDSANPDTVGILPLSAFVNESINSEKFQDFEVRKGPVPNDLFKPSPKKEEERNAVPLKFTIKKNHRIVAALSLISLVALILFFTSPFKSFSESKMKERITDYYAMYENGNFNQMPGFIAPVVDRWFDNYNEPLAKIQKATLEYREKYPNAQVNINWDTFKWEKDNEGNIRTEYEVLYKLKAKGAKNFRPYHLKVHSVWNSDMQIISMYEENLK